MSPEFEMIDVRDELLKHLLGNVPHNINGVPQLKLGDSLIHNGNKKCYRNILTYLWCRLFNFHRYPGYHERDFALDKDFCKSLKPECYDSALADLKRLYEHTQYIVNSEQFKTTYGIVDDKITLRRGVDGSYAHQFIKKKKEGNKEFQVRTDIWSFYSRSGYDRSVVYTLDVELKNILLYDRAVNIETSVTPYCGDEFIVFNPDPTGHITVDSNRVTVYSNFIPGTHYAGSDYFHASCETSSCCSTAPYITDYTIIPVDDVHPILRWFNDKILKYKFR